MSSAGLPFALNWELTRAWLRLSRRPRAGEPEIGSPLYLTTVVRLPGELAGALAGAASRIVGHRPPHYIYPPETIHLTVSSLAECPDPELLVEAALARHQRFEVEVRGLNVSAHTVFAELQAVGPELEAIRRDLRRGESSEHGRASRWLRRRLAHANLVRFTGPVEARLLAEVGRLRRAQFGAFEVGEIELARTDKVLSAAGTRPLGVHRLG